MKLIDFIEKSELSAKKQEEQIALLCYWHYKNTRENTFDMQAIGSLVINAGFKPINSTRVKNALIKSGKMQLVDGLLNTMKFCTLTLETYEKDYASHWSDYIESDSELMDEKKFCGKRGYLDKLIKQMNCCYKNNCYDACAVLMRRLFEILLILSYQKLGIDNEIKDTSGKYFMLEGIVSNAKNNHTLNLSRIKLEYDKIRDMGNSSAHGITYIASEKDINDIKHKYRAAIEELFDKAGILI